MKSIAIVPENPLAPLDGPLKLKPFIHVSLRRNVYPGHRVSLIEQNEIADDLNLNLEACKVRERKESEATGSLDQHALKDEEATTDKVAFPLKRRELTGRRLGDDYSKLNGFSMYGGRTLPGFPRIKFPLLPCDALIIHVVLEGTVDLVVPSSGLRARLQAGDVFWKYLKKINPIEWSEMYPPLSTIANPHSVLEIAMLCNKDNENTQEGVIWGTPGKESIQTLCDNEDIPLTIQRIKLEASSQLTLCNSHNRSALVIIEPTEAMLTIEDLPSSQGRAQGFFLNSENVQVQNKSTNTSAHLLLITSTESYLPTNEEYECSLKCLQDAQEEAEREAPELGTFDGEEWIYVDSGSEEASLVFGPHVSRFFQTPNENKRPPVPIA